MPLTPPRAAVFRTLAVALALLAAGLSAACDRTEGAGIVALGDGRGYVPPAVAVEGARYHFTPLEGIPVNLADRILRSLQLAARSEGITVVRRADRPADFRVFGHVTAVSNDTSSIVFYDFDVVDAATGQLLHRISGQQTSDPSRGDPWARVTGSDISAMSEVVAARLSAWIRGARA